MGVVRAEFVAQGVAHLADRDVSCERLPDRDEQIVVAARRLPHPLERRLRRRSVSLRTDAARPLDLPPLRGGIEGPPMP